MMMRIVSRGWWDLLWGCGMDVFIATASLSFAGGILGEIYIVYEHVRDTRTMGSARGLWVVWAWPSTYSIAHRPSHRWHRVYS